MPHEQLGLSNDELLSTTRAVRKRLDFDRPVSEDVLRECMEVAVQAPTGSNAQGWQFVFVTDPEKKAKIGEIYRQAFSIYRDMPVAIHKLNMDSSDNTSDRQPNPFCIICRLPGREHGQGTCSAYPLYCRAHRLT